MHDGSRRRLRGRDPSGGGRNGAARTEASRVARLERLPDGPVPVPLAEVAVPGNGVVPSHQRDVEEVEADAEAVAAEREALVVVVEVLRLREMDRLAIGPGEPEVVEEEPVHRWEPDGEDAEIHAANEREAE